LFHRSLAERFTAIYENRVWLNGRSTGSLSGLGSEIEHTTSLRLEIPKILRDLNAQLLVDVGCGDFTWMKEVDLPCSYIGLDIVPAVINANESLFGSEERSFCVLDATTDPLPRGDVFLCREVMFHLSFSDIWRLIENIRRSEARFLLATSDSTIPYNADILSGDFRLLNLGRKPFDFPTPERLITDACVAPGRILGVWRTAALPHWKQTAL